MNENEKNVAEEVVNNATEIVNDATTETKAESVPTKVFVLGPGATAVLGGTALAALGGLGYLAYRGVRAGIAWGKKKIAEHKEAKAQKAVMESSEE